MRHLILAALVVVAATACSACSIGAEPAPQNRDASKSSAPSGEKPKPEDVLRRMADYLCGLDAFSCRVESTLEIKAKGMDNHMTTKMVARLQRPNRLAIVLEEGAFGATIISDGKQLVQYMPAIQRYTVSAAPADLADFGKAEEPGAASIMGMPPLPTTADAFYKSLVDGVTKSEYVGAEKVGEIECHHCRFVQNDFDWDIWIAAKDKPLIYKLVPDFSKRFAEGGGALKEAKMSYTVLFFDWNIAPKFSDADFAFTPPEGAEKVDSLFENLGSSEEPGPHPLLGQPAPPFATVDLEEQPIDLKSHLGKNVILLDFWATWCGPCFDAFPALSEWHQDFARDGLVIIGMTRYYGRADGMPADHPNEIAFLKRFKERYNLGYDFAVADGQDAQYLYAATALPTTVLIDRKGVIRYIESGTNPTRTVELREMVVKLLNEKVN